MANYVDEALIEDLIEAQDRAARRATDPMRCFAPAVLPPLWRHIGREPRATLPHQFIHTHIHRCRQIERFDCPAAGDRKRFAIEIGGVFPRYAARFVAE